MNCLLEFGEPENGRRVARCRRCSTVLSVPLSSGENVQVECTGLPLPHERDGWLEFFAEAFGLHRAAAICRFIRWRFRGSRLEELPKELPPPILPPLNAGPGTELHKLLAELGIKPDASCGCEAWRQKMDAWGPAGCREHDAEILEHLTAAYKSTDWPTYFKAASLAALTGKPKSLRGLLALAIERSEAVESRA